MSLSPDDTVASRVGEALLSREARLAVVESTAGGLISARLLSVAGASRWFDRGAVAYGGRSKQDMTGIDVAILREHGAVSLEAVAALAEGIRGASGVNFALAESGMAGPQGSRRSAKPVGAVVIAVSGPGGTDVKEYSFDGSRVEIMTQIADQALTCLGDYLERST
ncbi:MAG TPA: CinA family protein [Dehalococcoidia bacterium]|jgi:PncC family amidohydrolase|nr:CinA family protein [Dehalococcoidia bacterium]